MPEFPGKPQVLAGYGVIQNIEYVSTAQQNNLDKYFADRLL